MEYLVILGFRLQSCIICKCNATLFAVYMDIVIWASSKFVCRRKRFSLTPPFSLGPFLFTWNCCWLKTHYA